VFYADIKKGFFLITGLFVFTCAFSQPKDERPEGNNNLVYVDPTIGNVGLLLQPTRPTVQLPNQMMRIHPQRKDYTDDQISSFPLIIVSHRLGQNLIKPGVQVSMGFDFH